MVDTATPSLAKLPSEAHETYYGKPLVFDAKRHRYEWDGKLVPGVTTILRRLAKPALIQWSADMACQYIRSVARPRDTEAGQVLEIVEQDLLDARLAHARIRDDAADIGKLVHKYAEGALGGKAPEPVEGDAAKSACAAFDDWLQQHRVEPISLERRVLSRRWYYAGTTDFFGLIDGRPSILDFKSSSAIYSEFWLQLAAYEIALKEQLGVSEDLIRWVIRLDKRTGRFEAKSMAWNAAHEDAWLSLVEVHKSLSKIEDDAKEAIRGVRQRKA